MQGGLSKHQPWSLPSLASPFAPNPVDAERTPVWLMRQAGRYMAEFRAYSDKYPFRMRSETPDIAIELSLQPWRAFKPDGVIFFSDILTPLPALGIEFDVIKGKGPRIDDPIRSMDQVKRLRTLDDPTASLPFVHEILSSLRWVQTQASTGRWQQWGVWGWEVGGKGGGRMGRRGAAVLAMTKGFEEMGLREP